jgi:hypothetical protein
LSYQWKKDGVPIAAATGLSYLIPGTSLQSFISVTVTARKVGYVAVSKTSSPTLAVAAGTFTRTPTPTISGKATVGKYLTANPGTWDSGVTLTYRWKRSGANISGATASTYRWTSADRVGTITVTVTGTKRGYTTVSKISKRF